MQLLVASQTLAGFAKCGRLTTLDLGNEAESGSMLAAHVFAFQGFRRPDCSAACSIGYLMNEQLQGKLLSAHKNNQTSWRTTHPHADTPAREPECKNSGMGRVAPNLHPFLCRNTVQSAHPLPKGCRLAKRSRNYLEGRMLEQWWLRENCCAAICAATRPPQGNAYDKVILSPECVCGRGRLFVARFCRCQGAGENTMLIDVGNIFWKGSCHLSALSAPELPELMPGRQAYPRGRTISRKQLWKQI